MKTLKNNMIPIAFFAVTVVGAILIALHMQAIGLAVAGVGMLASIVGYAVLRKKEERERVAYVLMSFAIMLFVLCVIGFAAWTGWDLYAPHHFG